MQVPTDACARTRTPHRPHRTPAGALVGSRQSFGSGQTVDALRSRYRPFQNHSLLLVTGRDISRGGFGGLIGSVDWHGLACWLSRLSLNSERVDTQGCANRPRLSSRADQAAMQVDQINSTGSGRPGWLRSTSEAIGRTPKTALQLWLQGLSIFPPYPPGEAIGEASPMGWEVKRSHREAISHRVRRLHPTRRQGQPSLVDSPPRTRDRQT